MEEKKIEYDTIQYDRINNLVQLNRANQELDREQLSDLAAMADNRITILEIIKSENEEKIKNGNLTEKEIKNLEEENRKLEELQNNIAKANIKLRSEKDNQLSKDEAAAILKGNEIAYSRQSTNVNELKSGLEGLKLAQQGYTQAQIESMTASEKAVILEKIAQKERQQTISLGVQGLTSLVSLGITLSGVIKTLNDDSLSATEKFERVLPTILMTIPSLITSLKSIGSIIPMLGIEFKAFGNAVAEAATKILGFEVAASSVLLTLAAITAVLVAVGVAAYNYAQKQDAASKELERASKAAERAAESFTKTKEAYDNLKSSIENYNNAEKALKSMIQYTDE